MTQPKTDSKKRARCSPATKFPPITNDEIADLLEEVRRLRAAMQTYRELVTRLLGRRG